MAGRFALHRSILVRRIAARLLDAATVFAILFALVVLRIFWFMDSVSNRFDPDPWGRAFAPTLMFVAIYAVYELVFTVARGQTPGKDRLNLRVQSCESGGPPRWHRGVVRFVPIAVCMMIPPAWVGAAAVSALGLSAFAAGGRTVHDLVAGTEVVDYDTDAEEGPLPEHDRERLRSTYGPRSALAQLVDRLERR